jgi:aspartyl/asparaginyl-tRNA synthetase
VIFLDLRDRYGITQVVPSIRTLRSAHAHAVANVRMEWVLQVTGPVKMRPAGMQNPKMATGEVEVDCRKVVEVLNQSKPLPFMVSGENDAGREYAPQIPLSRPAPRTHDPQHGPASQGHKFMRDFLDEQDLSRSKLRSCSKQRRKARATTSSRPAFTRDSSTRCRSRRSSSSSC